MRVSLFAAAGFAWLLLVSVASSASAQSWYESYAAAEAALERSLWSEAMEYLHQALEERPSSGSKQRSYGMRFVDYYPFLKLGVAYFHLGQLDAAEQALETEARLGAVKDSRPASAQLEQYRNDIRQERVRVAQARLQDVEAQVSASLQAALRLESGGQLLDALTTLDRALALSPQNGEALDLRGRLREALADQQRTAARESQFKQLAEAGRTAVTNGDFELASLRFAEALDIQRDPEIERLSAIARQRIQDELRSTATAPKSDRPGSGAAAVRAALSPERRAHELVEQARRLQASGDSEAALRALQRALAIAPEDRAAADLQRALIRADLETGRATDRQRTLEQLSAEADEHFEAGRFDQSLAVLHQILAYDATDEVALRRIAQAYQHLGANLSDPLNAPPVIVFDMAAMDDSGPDPAASSATPHAATSRSREVLLTGSVYHGGTVGVRVTDSGHEAGEMSSSSREVRGVWVTEFRWQTTIPKGTSHYLFEAVTPSSETHTRPFSYIYSAPWYRAGWWYTSLASGLLLVLALLVAQRRRRRNRLLRGRFNPYVAGAPILEAARFFGRKKLLDYVLRRVPNNCIMLYGERRIGKTSFQHQLKRALSELDDPDHKFFPVFIDLQGVPQERFFATVAGEIFHELGPKLPGIQPQLAPTRDEYGYRDLVKDMSTVLKLLNESTSRKVKLVLLIDEVDELNDYDPRVNQRLRSLFMRAFADNLSTVVSGVSIKKQWEREGSPWYNFFQEIEVKPLDSKEAQSLIEAPVRGVFNFEQDVAQEIIRRTTSKPYLIQRLCASLVDRMHEERRTRISLSDVDATCQAEGL